MPSSKPKTTLPAFTPVPRKCNRYDGWTPERQQLFIEALADYGSVRAAANSVGMTPESAYYLRRQPDAESFAGAWQAALDHGVKRIEDTAMDRALNGVEVPVYSYGKLVGTRRVYNDRLLMFMLRNRAPGRFAADGARGLSGLDKQRLAEEKKRWRQEWARESKAKQLERRKGAYEKFTARIETMQKREQALMSPETRRLQAEFQASLARDRADPFAWQDEANAARDAQAEHTTPVPSEAMRRLLPKRGGETPEADDGWDIADPAEKEAGNG